MGVTPADVDTWMSPHMRDVNCLHDPERGARKRSAEHLAKQLLHHPDRPRAPLLQALLCGPLLRPLARLLEDPTERCREIAVDVLTHAAAHVPHPDELLVPLAPLLHFKVGSDPVREPSEEIRYAMMQLLAGPVMTRCSAGTLASLATELVAMVRTGLLDAFHEVKKAACRALVVWADRVDAHVVHVHAKDLLETLAATVSHPHSKVRQALSGALTAVVRRGVTDETLTAMLAPLGGVLSVKALIFDPAPLVRLHMYRELRVWLECPPAGMELEGGGGGDASPAPSTRGAAEATTSSRPPAPSSPSHAWFLPRAGIIVPTLLLGVTDPSPDLQKEVLSLLETVPESLVPTTTTTTHTTAAIQAAQLPTPYGAELPAAPLISLVSRVVGSVVPPAASALKEWTVSLRLAAARTLHTAMVVAGPAVVAEGRLETLLPALAGAVGDDELDVARWVVLTLHAMGALVDVNTWYPASIDLLVAAKVTPSQRLGALTGLAASLHAAAAAGQTVPVDLLDAAVRALRSTEVRGAAVDVVGGGVRRQIVEVCDGLARVAVPGDGFRTAAGGIYEVLLQVMGAEEARTRAEGVLVTVAQRCGWDSPTELAAQFAPRMLDHVTEGHGTWTHTHPDLLAFLSLLTSCSGATLGLLLPRIISTCASLLEHEREAKMRLSVLRTMDVLLEDPDQSQAFRGPLGGLTLMAVLLPPCVWKPSKAAAAVRYAAVVSIGTLLGRDMLDGEQLGGALSVGVDMTDIKKAQGSLLAVMSSLMDEDYYADTRHAALHAMSHLLRIAGAQLTYEQRRFLYPELMKRLDDPNDKIRELAGVVTRIFVESSGVRGS